MKLFKKQRSGELPGRRRAAAANYYRAGRAITRSKEKPPSTSPSITRNLLARLSNAGIFVILAVVLIFCSLVDAQPRLTASSQVYRPLGVYRAAADAEFGSLGNRTKFSLDQNRIQADLKQRFPEVASASVSLALVTSKADVKLNISPPIVLLNNSSGSHIIDAQGVAVGRASDLPLAAKGLVPLDDQSNLAIKVGQTALSSGDISFIDSILAECQRARVPVNGLTLPVAAQELDLRTADKPYYTKFYLAGDPILQAGQYLAARQQLATNGGEPSTYLDVRVNGKIYYR